MLYKRTGELTTKRKLSLAKADSLESIELITQNAAPPFRSTARMSRLSAFLRFTALDGQPKAGLSTTDAIACATYGCAITERAAKSAGAIYEELSATGSRAQSLRRLTMPFASPELSPLTRSLAKIDFLELIDYG